MLSVDSAVDSAVGQFATALGRAVGGSAVAQSALLGIGYRAVEDSRLCRGMKGHMKCSHKNGMQVRVCVQ